MSQQARRARFYHRQRRLRASDRVFREYRHDPTFLGVVTDFRLNGMRVGTGRGLLFSGARPEDRRRAVEDLASTRVTPLPTTRIVHETTPTGRSWVVNAPVFQSLPSGTPEARQLIEAWRAENPSIVGTWDSDRYRK